MCGSGLNKAACELRGCCYDVGTFACYYPLDGGSSLLMSCLNSTFIIFLKYYLAEVVHQGCNISLTYPLIVF